VAHRQYVADDGKRLEAVPFEFVGRADDCGGGYAAGSRIVTAASGHPRRWCCWWRL